MNTTLKKDISTFFQHCKTAEGKKILGLAFEILMNKMFNFFGKVAILLYGLVGLKKLAEFGSTHLKNVGVNTTQIWVIQDSIKTSFIVLLVILSMSTIVTAILRRESTIGSILMRTILNFLFPFVLIGIVALSFLGSTKDYYGLAWIILLIFICRFVFSGIENGLLKKYETQLFKPFFKNDAVFDSEGFDAKTISSFDSYFEVSKEWAPYVILQQEWIGPQRDPYQLELTRTYRFAFLPLVFERKIILGIGIEENLVISTVNFIKSRRKDDYYFN